MKKFALDRIFYQPTIEIKIFSSSIEISLYLIFFFFILFDSSKKKYSNPIGFNYYYPKLFYRPIHNHNGRMQCLNF